MAKPPPQEGYQPRQLPAWFLLTKLAKAGTASRAGSGAGGSEMFSATLQPVSRDQIMKLAEGRVGAGERRQIVRRLVAQAARCQVTAGFDPFSAEPVAEASYDLPLRRAFERACRLHER